MRKEKQEPCIGCEREQECKRDGIACGEFAAYVAPAYSLRRYGRHPNREWFAYVFDKTDSDHFGPTDHQRRLLAAAVNSQFRMFGGATT